MWVFNESAVFLNIIQKHVTQALNAHNKKARASEKKIPVSILSERQQKCWVEIPKNRD